MKYWLIPIFAIVFLASGCGPNTEQASVPTQSLQSQPPRAQPVKLTPQQELAKYCRVCVVDKGEKIEEYFPSRLNTRYGGKDYKFCADDCKKKFDANSKRYALK